MIGLIIGVLWYVMCVLVGKQTPEAAVVDISNFLFYWYCVFGAIMCLIPVGISLCGAIGTVAGIATVDGKTLGGGLLLGTIGLILGVLLALKSGLWIVASWLVYHAGDAATPFAEWDTQYLIAAGICAFLAVLLGMGGKAIKADG